MELKEFAKLLDGNEIGKEVSLEHRKIAKDNGFVIIYGASDDLAIIDGAISDEVGSLYNGGEIAFAGKDLFVKQCEDDECPHESKIFDDARKIEAEWCQKDNISWSYKTDLPHEKFNIVEDGEVYCEGIVFKRSDL